MKFCEIPLNGLEDVVDRPRKTKKSGVYGSVELKKEIYFFLNEKTFTHILFKTWFFFVAYQISCSYSLFSNAFFIINGHIM